MFKATSTIGTNLLLELRHTDDIVFTAESTNDFSEKVSIFNCEIGRSKLIFTMYYGSHNHVASPLCQLLCGCYHLSVCPSEDAPSSAYCISCFHCCPYGFAMAKGFL